MQIDLAAIERKMQNPEIQADLAEIHIRSALDLVDCLVLDEVGLRDFTQGAPINRDDQPYLDFHVPRVLGPDEIIWARNLEAVLRFRRAPWKTIRISGPDSLEKRNQLQRRALSSSVLWKGIVSELRGEVAQARQLYRMAMQLDPTDPDPPFLLAASQALVSKLRRKVELDPEDYESRIRLGTLYFGEGKLDSARAVLEEALRINPRSAEAHANLGAVLLNRGKTEEAIRELQRALELDPNLPLAYYNLGFAYAQGLGDYRRAAEAWEHAVQLDPGYQPAHYNLALALLKLGDRGEAILHLQTAATLAPDDPSAHRLLGLLLAERGDAHEASYHLREYLRLAPFAQDAAKIRAMLRRLEGTTTQPVQ